MLIDARELPHDTVLRADVCVIGSGAAGVTAALELARARTDVVLLEAGGRRLERRPQETYKGLVGPSDLYRPELKSLHPPLDTVRQKRLGGTTGAWGGRCSPLDSIDFESREHVPHSGWPIDRQTLDPYYVRANRYAEAGAFEYLSRLAFPTSPRYMDVDVLASAIDDTRIWRFSPPTDFGKRYGAEIRANVHLRAYLHANALWLDIDAIDGRVRAVTVASVPGRHLRVEARQFIVAVGGLETARLLLVSAERSRSRLGAGHDALGSFYMTHLDGTTGSVRFRGPVPKNAYSYERSRDDVYCRRLLRVRDEIQARERLLNLSAVFYMPNPADPSHRDGVLSAFVLAKEAMYRTKAGFRSRRFGMGRTATLDIGQHVRNALRDPLDLAALALRWPWQRWLAPRAVPSFLTRSKSGEYRFHFSAEQSPSASNRVTLASERDAFGIPRSHVRWSPSRSDHDSIVRSLRLLATGMERSEIASVDVPSTVEELTTAEGRGFLGGTHAMGTARMSPSPRSGVVDGQCRVHGIENLFVASSAVFPTSGSGPPTLTIIALAIRIAEAVMVELRSR